MWTVFPCVVAIAHPVRAQVGHDREAGMESGKGAVVEAWVAKRYWRAKDARAAVAAWRRSGKGLSQFAAQHHLDQRRITRWVDKLGEPARGAKVDFHPVRLVEGAGPADKGDPIEVVLADGRRVRVPQGFMAEDLARVLVVLEGRSAC